MAHSTVHLQDPHSACMVEAPVGFSWTTLFFGFLLFAYRQDWILAFVCMVLTFMMGPLPNLVLCWFYNRWYLHRLIKGGWQVQAVHSPYDLAHLSQQVGVQLKRPQLNG